MEYRFVHLQIPYLIVFSLTLCGLLKFLYLVCNMQGEKWMLIHIKLLKSKKNSEKPSQSVILLPDQIHKSVIIWVPDCLVISWQLFQEAKHNWHFSFIIINNQLCFSSYWIFTMFKCKVFLWYVSVKKDIWYDAAVVTIWFLSETSKSCL